MLSADNIFRGRFAVLVAFLAFGTCGALLIAPSALADQTITSAGPLTSIGIGSDLSCSVNHTGDSFGELFGNTECAGRLWSWCAPMVV